MAGCGELSDSERKFYEEAIDELKQEIRQLQEELRFYEKELDRL